MNCVRSSMCVFQVLAPHNSDATVGARVTAQAPVSELSKAAAQLSFQVSPAIIHSEAKMLKQLSPSPNLDHVRPLSNNSWGSNCS